jgi:Na+/melibiose symporter-like transporter
MTSELKTNQENPQSSDDTTTPPVDGEGQPVKPLTPIQVFWYNLASLGCGTFFSFNNFVLPLFLQRYTNNAVILFLMSSSHSVEGSVIQPIVGTMSDRMRSPMGRRRPFMLLFFPLTALFLIATPFAGAYGGEASLWLVVLSIFLFTVFFNIAYDPYQALLPDITPVDQRGRVAAIFTLLGVIGQAGILLAPLPLLSKFYAVAGVLLVTVLLTCLRTREPHPVSLPAAHRSHWNELKEAVRGLRTLHQAAKSLAVFFLTGIGIGAVLPGLSLFVKEITHCSDQQAQLMPMILMGCTALAVVPFGKLADRVGTQRVLAISAVLIGIAGLCGLWVTTLTQIAAVMVVAGVGNAAQGAASYPLMTQLVPAREVGFYTGLQTMALSILQPLTVVLTGMMVNQGGYRSIFAVLAVCMFLALAMLTKIKFHVAEQEIEERNRIIDEQATKTSARSEGQA